MVNPFAELPLAIFTTLMPLAAGIFIPYAVLCFKGAVGEERAAKLDSLSIVSLVILVIGFIGAFFHLGNPANALNVANGIGRSPLSNGVLVAGIFTLLVLAYAVMARMGKLSEGSRKGFLGVLVAAGVVLAVFTGLVYFVPTIPSWASAWPSVEQVGYFLMGAALGLCGASFLGGDLDESDAKTGALAVIAGLVVALVALCIHLMQVSGMHGVTTMGSDLVSAAMPYAVAGIICCAAGAALAFLAAKAADRKTRYAIAAVAIVVGVFLARLSFYCLQLNVGM